MPEIEKFYKSYGAFFGKFESFLEAKRFSPITNIGYDNKETLQRMIDNIDILKSSIRETEYPFFLWLNKILEKNTFQNILDFGGALGAHFYNFNKLCLHENFHWFVYDVAHIINFAKEEYKVDALSFHENIKEIKNIDIFIASGSIQYIEDFSLKQLNNLPNHLLFARLPLNEKCKTFVTLQNGISSFNPQYVYNRLDFINSIKELGYELIDEWKSHYDKCIIPNFKEESCKYYSGLYFRKIDE